MGASVIPALSTTWVELATSTASGSSVSFTSLAEYRNYKVSYFNLKSASASSLYIRFNNDSGNNYSWINIKDSGTISSSAVDNGIEVHVSIDTSGSSGIFGVSDANQVIKKIDYFAAKSGTGTDSDNGQAFWNNTAVINRIDLVVFSTTFSSGTIKVYGSN